MLPDPRLPMLAVMHWGRRVDYAPEQTEHWQPRSASCPYERYAETHVQIPAPASLGDLRGNLCYLVQRDKELWYYAEIP